MALLKDGLGVRKVARTLGCAPSSVSRWQAEVRAHGRKALRAKPPPGRPPRLTPAQRRQLTQLLLQGATAHGFSTPLWTLSRVAAVIARTFGVTYHPAHVWRVLQAAGWSCQKPERRARERDEAAIHAWRTTRWPHIKKRPPRP